MGLLSELLASNEPSAPLPGRQAAALAQRLSALVEGQVYTSSIVAARGEVLFLARQDGSPVIGVITATQGGLDMKLLQPNHAALAQLREKLPFLHPRCVGLRRTIGCGDRLGIATPGHIRAVRGKGLAVVLAQQSIREMTRTGRSPQNVLDDATLGVFQEGFRDGFGADADHLKTPADIDACLAASFVMFTIDPGEHVDNEIDLPEAQLDAKFEALPWAGLESSPADCRRRLGNLMDARSLARAAVKYGRAVAHSAAMYRHLKSRAGSQPFEVEVSVDETSVPTSADEHRYVASELRRLGVEWVSLAPRFVGAFEKGVDYIGDLAEFERTLAEHHAIARELGPYKIGLHSGSDKFSVYPIAAHVCGELVHVKTAGTSYLVALSVAARHDPPLFRDILAYARERYPQDRASYHVSARLERVPEPGRLRDDELPALVDQFDARQVLHVTFGSVVSARPDLRARLMKLLNDHEEEHYAALAAHIGRHIAPFANADCAMRNAE